MLYNSINWLPCGVTLYLLYSIRNQISLSNKNPDSLKTPILVTLGGVRPLGPYLRFDYCAKGNA